MAAIYSDCSTREIINSVVRGNSKCKRFLKIQHARSQNLVFLQTSWSAAVMLDAAAAAAAAEVVTIA